MVRKLLVLVSVTAAIAFTGCVKETYHIDTLSKKAHWSPAFGVSAVRGDVSLSDLKNIPNDTVVFDNDNFVRIIYRQDSVIEFRMEDYYDLNDMVSYNDTYTIGEIDLAPFTGSVFPLSTTGEIPFPLFTNFVNATLSQGVLEITVRNNTPAIINNITITIFNNSPRIQLGDPAIISAINPGQTGSSTINLADFTLIRNSTSAAFVISGGPGMVPDGSNLEISMTGRDMKVRSGRVIVPPQPLQSLDNHDDILFDPGQDVEIDVISISSGSLSYTINNGTPLRSTVSLTLPTALRGTNPVSEAIIVNPGASFIDSIALNNSVIDLGTVVSQPYNMLPVDYLIEISSENNLVNFNSMDEITLDLSLLSPDFDYVKGYFGKQTETIDQDTLDLGLEEIFSRISGTFHLANPSITLRYRNSFSIPVEVDFKGVGYKRDETVPLNLLPFIAGYPKGPDQREKDTLFTVNKDNSSLDDLVSMPPERVIYSGSAVMNPDGNTGSRDNYIFDNSRFIGDLEVEVPLEFSMNNLQFADTVENFMKNENNENESINFEDFEFLRIDITAENGFPLGVSLSMSLYNSATGDTLNPISAPELLKPASVDNTGKVTGPMTSETSFTITRNFWDSINEADMIIFTFTMVTSDGGTKDVKIYADYRIDFKATLVLKPDIKFNLK